MYNFIQDSVEQQKSIEPSAASTGAAGIGVVAKIVDILGSFPRSVSQFSRRHLNGVPSFGKPSDVE